MTPHRISRRAERLNWLHGICRERAVAVWRDSLPDKTGRCLKYYARASRYFAMHTRLVRELERQLNDYRRQIIALTDEPEYVWGRDSDADRM